MKPLNNAQILCFFIGGNPSTNGIYVSQVGGLDKYCEKLGDQTMIWDNGMTRKMWFFSSTRLFQKISSSYNVL